MLFRSYVEESAPDVTNMPPFVLILKRKAIRYYPNDTRVALYHNQKLDKYFSIPYGTGVDGVIQAEEVEPVDEGHQVVATTKQGETFKSGVHPTKEKALAQHYKMAKSGNFKKVDTVKVKEEVEQIEEIRRGGFTAGWRDEKYFGKGVPTNRPMTDKEKVESQKKIGRAHV